MRSHEPEVPDDGGGKISHSFSGRSSVQKLLLMLGNRLDVFLHMIWNLHFYLSNSVLRDWMSGQRTKMGREPFQVAWGFASKHLSTALHRHSVSSIQTAVGQEPQPRA